jgi:hypothetical protein
LPRSWCSSRRARSRSGSTRRRGGSCCSTSSARRSSRRGHWPPPARTLLLSALSLILSALLALADALGAEGGPGSTLWVSLVFAAVAGFGGWRLNSPVSALLSSASLGVAFFAAIDLLFGLDSVDTARWLLLVLAVAYAAVAALLLQSRYRHAVQHVSAAGLAVTGLVLLSFGDIFASAFGAAFIGDGGSDISFNGPTGWELIGVLASAAVIAFAVVRREPGPGWIGVIALSAATGLASFPDTDASLIGWPVVFIVLALAATGAVFAQGGASLPGGFGGGGNRRRGAQDAPPPPPPPPPGSAPPPGARP